MRLIDVDELMKKFHDIEFNAKHELFGTSRELALEGLKHIKKAIDGLPTIDPLKHGHWEIYEGQSNTIVACSECEHPVNYFWDDWKSANYCPNCGAKMDGEK